MSKSESPMFKLGFENRKAVLGAEHVEKSWAAADDFNRPMQELVTEYCWGAIWGRDDLPRKTRSLLNIAMLTALNRPHELKAHLRARSIVTHSTGAVGAPYTQALAALYGSAPYSWSISGGALPLGFMADEVDALQARTFTTAPPGAMPYRLFIPTNYSAAERYPLVMFLHGHGAEGNDNLQQLVVPDCLAYVSYSRQLTRPAISHPSQTCATTLKQSIGTRRSPCSPLRTTRSCRI